jgi:hypothetical protein
LALNFRTLKEGLAEPSGVKVSDVTGGVSAEGSDRLDSGAVPPDRIDTPVGKVFQALTCFTGGVFPGSSSKIA